MRHGDKALLRLKLFVKDVDSTLWSFLRIVIWAVVELCCNVKSGASVILSSIVVKKKQQQNNKNTSQYNNNWT